jgi:membrane protease YdiL (CAAX protease family)
MAVAPLTRLSHIPRPIAINVAMIAFVVGLLVLGRAVVPGRVGTRKVSPRARGRSAAEHCALALGVYALSAMLLSGGSVTAVYPVAIGIVVAAWLEEIAFRGMLPTFIRQLVPVKQSGLRRALLIAAQASFAACHVVPGAAAHGPDAPFQFVRLVVVGILYMNLTEASGLWAAVGVHAAMNVDAAAWSMPTHIVTWRMLGAAALASVLTMRVNAAATPAAAAG